LSQAGSSDAVIVTRKEIERILIGKNGEAVIGEAAGQQGSVEQAQAMAMLGGILRELQKAAAAQGGTDRVLVTAQHGPTSRLQSLIASGEVGNIQLTPLSAGGLEATFDTADWAGWATVAWAKLREPKRHALLSPSQREPQPLLETGRVGLLGDWATGLYGAPHIASAILRDRDPFMMLMHLGDVYYAGTQGETRTRFLNRWPARPDATHRALNGNHEMYSGGHFYFDETLPHFHQDASYFAHQNKHWTLIGLDLAYTDHAIDDAQVEWVQGVLQQAGDRKVLFFSHHQLFSRYESQGTKLWKHPGFAKMLKSRRIFAWYWGHEHRCVIYQEPDNASGLLGRCIGHGGMPQSRAKTYDLPSAPGPNKADWRLAPQLLDPTGARLAPPSLVLEGPNPYIPGEQDLFSPHGYAVLTFDGPRLIEQVMDADGNVIYEQNLA
jgi:hypothetical protein